MIGILPKTSQPSADCRAQYFLSLCISQTALKSLVS